MGTEESEAQVLLTSRQPFPEAGRHSPLWEGRAWRAAVHATAPGEWRKDPTLSQSEPGDVVGWVMGTITEADKRIRNFPAVWKPLVWREEPGGEGW